MKKYLFIIYIISIQTFSQNVEMTYNVNQIDEKFVANENQKIKLLVNSLNNHSDFTVYTEKANDSIFSIYIQNNTNDSINLSTQDWHLYLIQEAKNENNKWLPIEYWRYSWCGNSFLSRKVKAKEIIRTETVAYNGNFETEIRFKFLNNSKVYYSNILKGKTEYVFKLNDCKEIYKIILQSTLAERKKIKGLIKMRVDMIVVSSVIVNYVVNRLQIKKMRLSTYSLKEGVIEQLIKNN